jgi:cell division protein FtsW (lipid II flippase)
LTNAAFARFPHIPLIWSPAGVVFLILLGAVRDFLVNRRVHKVYLYALPLYIAIEILAVQTYTHGAHWWLRIADQLLH